MNKINFTKEHLATLRSNIADLIIDGAIINGPMGQSYDGFSLMNTLSIKSLASLSAYIGKKKADLSVEDVWIENPNAEEVKRLQFIKETISLIIGYKRKQQELADNAREKARLEKQITELEESQKTPAELLAELKAKAAALDD